MNPSDLSLKTSITPELKASGDMKLGGNNSCRKGAPVREKGINRKEDHGVISLDFAEGVWQQAVSGTYEKGGIYLDFRRGYGIENTIDDIRNDEVCYDRSGALLVRATPKGRFIDGLI